MVAGRGALNATFPTSEIHHFVMAITAAQAMSRHHDVSVWMRRSFPATGEMVMIEALALALVAVALALPLLVMATAGPLESDNP
jgi:uncharacterized membrane protein YidH (DUF202 family)